ncbi:hypothetical protein CEXT_504211 [Caerostris extrusa]|uniref:Uncharacterized protein n=1 Tax=Caerostris extrusa TaxID=172846 RepID=A0AAV4NZF1_CAEEX|nr:hypothetical protein CEXT_504211 [Caerostris extrusa]
MSIGKWSWSMVNGQDLFHVNWKIDMELKLFPSGGVAVYVTAAMPPLTWCQVDWNRKFEAPFHPAWLGTHALPWKPRPCCLPMNQHSSRTMV